MAEFPLDPPLSNVLASVELVCSDEILAIIAMIQTGNIFYRTREEQAKADQKRAKFFFHSHSMTLGRQICNSPLSLEPEKRRRPSSSLFSATSLSYCSATKPYNACHSSIFRSLPPEHRECHRL
ncbi:hypothetical protein C1H46_017960 [Malus baccata]|uniref:Uncharacterized protein n=1 Tax=Malus baccata TaxID=106549 RepID=A0A540MCQ0_MALBA|nr:hypothetical protein C1H46_017960 [Malus baccata]